MAETIGPALFQSAPAATTPTDAYTCPPATNIAMSFINVCNRGAVAATYRLSISVGGGATATKDYLAYDETLAANTSLERGRGITLGPGDIVRVYASTADTSFNGFGVKKT